MKKFFPTGIFFTLFTFTMLSHSTIFAAEIAGVEGITYLTFLSEPPLIDIFSFEEGTDTFTMAIREEKTGGTGTYSDLGALFSADWTSTDDIIEPVEHNWQRFVAKGQSYEFTGNIPKLPEYTGEKLPWASGAFMSLPFHFEIPHSDKNNIASKVAQTGIAVEIVDW